MPSCLPPRGPVEPKRISERPPIKPPLDGKQVMDFLGVEPGPVVGEALGLLLEIRMEEGPIDEDEAFRRLRAWADERGL